VWIKLVAVTMRGPMPFKSAWLGAFLAPVLALAVAAPAAAEFPERPIRIMAPYAPGGNIDVTSRIIADKLKDVLGVTVLVENKAGASGMIGSDVIARSAPDGYNLLVSANSMVDIPAIYGNAPYDWKTAFQPISQIQTVPSVIVVTPSSPIKSFAEFIKAGIDKPGSLTIADSGIGTTNHIVAELLSAGSGAKYTLVHYKGGGQASIDVIAGQVPAQIDQLNASIGHIRGGKLRPLAVTSDKRVPELPDVPTVRELGIKGLEDFGYATYTGLFGPAKMPPAVLNKLHDAMVKVLTDPVVIKKFADLTAAARPSTPEELAAVFEKEDRVVLPLIKKLGIKVE